MRDVTVGTQFGNGFGDTRSLARFDQHGFRVGLQDAVDDGHGRPHARCHVQGRPSPLIQSPCGIRTTSHENGNDLWIGPVAERVVQGQSTERIGRQTSLRRGLAQ
eukprot:scaffold35143_cov130-Amphora_coffeaeformis.AAC.2